MTLFPHNSVQKILHATPALVYDSSVKALLAEPEIVTRKGKPVSVILPIADYQELLERLEDAEDLAYLKRARKKPLQYRSLDEYLAGRKGN